MARPGRKSAAQTPAPPSERIKGSSKNPQGTAASKKTASGIRFSAKVLKSLADKRDEHNSKYKRKASLPQLKAVYRRGLGAFSSSHRPTISGGVPNSRNAWAMARVNKFLMKLAGKKVKAAYVQDDDLMEDGGVTKKGTIEFMNWFAGWVKPLRGKMNIGMSIPNEFSQIKGVDDFVFLDVFEKIDQDIDAKPYLIEILSKADQLGVSVVLEPIPRHNQFLDDSAKRKKIDRQYLIGYYSKFGFSLMDNGLMHRMPGSVMADIRGMNKLIVCRACGWRWNTADSDESDKYVCHQCGFDNRTYYDADPIGTYANDGKVLDLINRGIVELKMFDTTPEHAKEYGLDSKNPLYLQKIYISNDNRLKGIGGKVIEYIIDYAKKNEHDLIFGHITQKAEPNIDVIKSMLTKAGFNTIEGNNDFYKSIDTKYADGGLIAPNGKPSNLTPEQWHLVRTPEFKAWFGDWENDPANASKVVDDNGEPKVVYHGSRSQFTTFDLSKGGESNTLARVGFWFSPNEGFGLNFTAGTWWGDIKGDYGIEYAVFLSIKNPKVFAPGESGELFSDSYERFKTDIYALAGQSARDANIGGLGMALNNAKQTIDDYRSMLKKDGYDGILIKQTRFDKSFAGDLNDQIVALYPEQIKLADGSNTTFDLNNPDIRFDQGGKIEKMAEKLELIQSAEQYASGGTTDDCGCGEKAEYGMETHAVKPGESDDKVLSEVNAILGKYGYEAIKKGDYPIGKVAKGMTIEDIARRHRYPIQTMKKSLELGIKIEKEHTNSELIAEKIALDHLYEDAEYYQKLQKIEKLYKGSEIDYDFNPMEYYVERDNKRTDVSLYLRDEKIEANNVLFSDEMKLSKAIICREKINHATEQENMAENGLEKNFWQAVKNIWENCMMMLSNHYYHALTNVENSYTLEDVYSYANGGLAYGNSHAKGGIPLYNKGSKSWIEIEGGEGVVKKESMQMNKTLEFEGKRMSACEIVSRINQMTGGVKFKCADVKKIMANDGNYD